MQLIFPSAASLPTHVAKHAAACAACQQADCKPLCATGSRLLYRWLIAELVRRMRDEVAASHAAEASHLHFPA